MIWLVAVLYLLGCLAILVTIVPMVHTTRWWVRMCDFPRFQTALLALAVLFAWPFVRWPLALDWLFLGALAAAFLWQMSWVWRYLPGAPREVGQSQPEAGSDIALLTTNVLRTNRDAAGLLQIIEDADPDAILAVETDEWWCSRLTEALESRYPHTLRYPLSTGYGLALFSRLELVEPIVRFVVDEAIPSIKSGVKLRDGVVIDLYGVHPRPPAVQQDSTERDLEFREIGKEIKRLARPAIVLGDLNDVAWSRTTVGFMQAGGLLDPRRGRGFYSTYPARMPGLRYPLDYIFCTPHFEVCSMRVLPRFSSDHLPLSARLRLTQ